MIVITNLRVLKPLFLAFCLYCAPSNSCYSFPDNKPEANRGVVPVGDRISGLATLMIKNYPEKIYVQTDRPIYSPNDTVWYKIWMLQGGTLFPTKKSRIVYVDLINEQNIVVGSKQYIVNTGNSNGEFIIPKEFQKSGLYRIRAYTRWQKNFGDSAYFEKVIPVWDNNINPEDEKPFVSEVNPQGERVFVSQNEIQKRKQKEAEAKLQRKDQMEKRAFYLDVQFLPEGGSLVAGLPSRVAFKALSPDGRSVPVEGTILDQEGKEILSFSSEHKGMGCFLLIPEKNKKYTARLFNKQIIALPAVEQQGVVLSLLSKPLSDTLALAINATPEVVESVRTYTLLVESRGLLQKNAYTVQMKRSRVIIFIPKDSLQSGINRFTLFTSDGDPLCERLVYVNNKDEIDFDVQAYWETKSDTNQMLTLKVVPRIQNQNVQAAFAVSLTNKKTVPVDTIQKTLRSEMLLSSDLKGYIEEPGYYFNHPYDSICKQLDLLLMTHGWSGFSWDDAVKRSFSYHPDTALSVSGKVDNLLGKPVKGRKISLLAQGGRMVADQCISDANGYFIFHNLNVREKSIVRVKIEKEKGKRLVGLGITFDSVYDKPSFPILANKDFLYDANKTDNLFKEYEDKMREDQLYLDSIRKRYGVHLLAEVTVEERRKIQNSYNRSGSGMGNIILGTETIGKYDAFASLIDILKAEIPGFKKSYCTKYDMNGRTVQSNYPQYNINGKPVFFQIDFDVIDRYLGTNTRIIERNVNPFTGQIEPAFQHAEDTEYGQMTKVEEDLRALVGSDIRAVEVLTSGDNLFNYRNILPVLDAGYRTLGFVVVITTKDGNGPREKLSQGTFITKLEGGATPRRFYVPKYYPKDPFDRIDFDQKQTLYWNPLVLTGGAPVELKIPVGASMKDNLQIEIEGSDLNGHIGTKRQPVILTKKVQTEEERKNEVLKDFLRNGL
ncbi:MAG: hypothetical protein PHI48_13550 [Bacteroidales bacterium]|nr:hypothetical protein [Bacteroidales bacterium]MDD4823567.1 hypothetical protein [Bacteroidales bacterium]